MHSSRMRTARSSSRLLGGRGERGVCLIACWDRPTHPLVVSLETPQLWPWRPPTPRCGPGDLPSQTPQPPPPGCGPGDPPWPDPSTSPLGVGLETPPARPLNLPSGCGPGDPPVDRILDTRF